VSRDGWVKRQKEVKDLSTTRLREGDAVLAVLAGSTRATSCSSPTSAWPTRARRRRARVHRLRRADSALFKFRDGERVVGAFSLDPRVAGDIAAGRRASRPPTTRWR
jgi:hypothetical protein